MDDSAKVEQAIRASLKQAIPDAEITPLKSRRRFI
jgi:hypothetical protein